MSEKYIKYDLDKDGVATLTIDMPGRSMNVIDKQLMQELDGYIDQVSADAAIKGAVVTSGKPAFVAGADLVWVEEMAAQAAAAPVEKVYAEAYLLSGLLRKMETCGKPFVAAIGGLAMGGGFEIILACHYRILADDPKIKLALPEVKVGLLPGAGGTQRLPRLMGVQPSLPYLLQGKSMSPQEALAFKVVQKLAPAAEIVAEAKKWILDGGKAVQPWDEKRFKVPGGQGSMNPTVVQTMVAATAMTRQQTKDNYPAPQAILSCVYEGHQVPIDTALRIEAKLFTTLMLDPTAGNMIRTLFINKGEADKLVRRPKGIEKQQVKKLGILGAGMMGAGIAYVSAKAGMEVVLLDRDLPSAEKGKNYSVALIEKAVSRGRMKKDKAEALLARIQPTSDYADLAGCDLIIEAVFEDKDLKADVTAKAEAVMPAGSIFASNTSTLPITGLAEASKRPDQFIGIHFFSPVDKMPLVEIIVGKKTGDRALATALDYVQQIRKTPIVVNDSRGFYTSRCFATFPSEGMAMLAEGISPALIENAASMAGMPVGALAVADEVSLELVYHAKEATKKGLGKAYEEGPSDKVVDHMVLDLKRLGKKAAKGFYDYPKGEKKHLWPGLAEEYPLAKEQPDVRAIEKRFLYRQAVEVVRCYEEGVVTAPADADIGAVFGWGFAPHTGGPLSMIDTITAAKFVEECDRMAQAFGPHFAPPKMLRDMAAKGQSFYS